MRILAADTSSRRISLALFQGGEIIEISQSMESPSAARFFVLQDALLAAAKIQLDALDCLALGSGPGSFTGLRVSFAAFRCLAWARAIPLYPVCSLEAMAYPYRSLDAPLIVRVPARRGQVYQYVSHRGQVLQELALLPCAEASARSLSLPEPRFLLSPADDEDTECVRLFGYPDAASIAALAADRTDPPPKLEDVLPLYLRPSDAEMSLSRPAKPLNEIT